MDMINKLLYNYKNGDFNVSIFEDGTLIRETDVENPKVDFPSSMDIKITNYCDLNCKYCHENSTVDGKHAYLNKLKNVVKDLPSGIEFAIGGGNPLSHSDLTEFLVWCKNKGYICNITVNQKHLYQYFDLLSELISNDLIKGLGVSITMNSFYVLEKICELSNHVVFHVIVGVNEIEIIDKLLKIPNCKILILGYKTFGRGVSYYTDNINISLKFWYKSLHKYIGKCILSFDNLAIEQLNIKRFFTIEGWKKFYMGDDFSFTMYIDAVEQKYAPTSRSNDRKSFDDYTLFEYFNAFKNNIE